MPENRSDKLNPPRIARWSAPARSSLPADAGKAVECYVDLLQNALRGQVDRIVLFGSRALGTSRRDSDYDIALFSNNVGSLVPMLRIASTLTCRFVELGLDIRPVAISSDRINEDSEFLEHIRQAGRVLYGDGLPMTVGTKKGKALSSFLRAESNLEDAYILDSNDVPAPVVQSSYRAIFQAAKAVVLFEKGVAPKDHDKMFLSFVNILGRDESQGYAELARYAQSLNTKATYEGSEAIDTFDAYNFRDDALGFVEFCAKRIGAAFDPAEFVVPED